MAGACRSASAVTMQAGVPMQSRSERLRTWASLAVVGFSGKMGGAGIRFEVVPLRWFFCLAMLAVGSRPPTAWLPLPLWLSRYV